MVVDVPQEKHPRASFEPYKSHAHRAFAPSAQTSDPKSAIVVLDTNVLLVPYETSAATLEEISRIYSKLRKENRLVIPGRVAREFARNRSRLVAELYKKVCDAKSIAINGRYALPPAVLGMEENRRAMVELEKAKDAMKAFKQAVAELADKIADWHQRDPVLDVYSGVFDASVIHELGMDKDAFHDIQKTRYEKRIPPGYRDQKKNDGGDGDLEIWLTILEVAGNRKTDAIFVTDDRKDDWAYPSDDASVFPRHELVLEFSEVTEKAYRQMSFSEFLAIFGAKESVVIEVREQERLGGASMSEHGMVTSVADILRRATDNQAPVMVNRGFPDVIVNIGSTVIGLEVVLARSRSNNLRKIIDGNIMSAGRAVSSGQYAEIAILLFSSDSSVVRYYENWFAEENFLGSGVSIIIGCLLDSGLKVLMNRAMHPVLRRAFEIETIVR
jgi:hypothetical protein